MNQQKQNIWQKIRIHSTKIIITILVILVMAAAAVVPSLIAKGAACRVLSHAKSVRLATQVTYYDYYATGETFFKENRTGIISGGEKKILELAQCEGTIHHVEFDEEGFRVSKLIYIESGYVVNFTDTGDDPHWTVYRLDKLIE